ncbi:MAG: ABC transporter permease [Candidatus Hermodarchaeota archaeon]
MLKNYLITALRNIRRNKGYSFINIFGLAVGIASCLLILLWVQDELSYDKFHDKADRLYRVARVIGDSKNERTPAILAPTLKDEFPEVSEVCRYRNLTTFVKIEDNYFNNQKLGFVDPSFFNLFTVEFIHGNPETSLRDNSSIILTRSSAYKFFGDENPIGRIVKVSVKNEYYVSSVINDYPSNSHIEFDCLVNFDSRDKTLERMFSENSWRVNGYSSYVLLNEGTELASVNNKIKDLIKRNHETSESEIYLQPVTDINLNPLEEEGNLKYLYIFSIIALFILTIACINFMNLSTARSKTRAKEVGMRKVIGANRSNLVKQFLGESFILTLFSVFVAYLLVLLLIPYFSDISGKQIGLSSILQIEIFSILFVITIVTTIMAGGYPAFYLSSLMPSTVFKKSLRSGKFAEVFRKYMVISQFAISIMLIVGVTVVYRQLTYMVNTDLGYKKNHMIYYVAPDEYIQNFESIRNSLLTNPNVVNATLGSPPMFLDIEVSNVTWDGKNESEETTFAKFHVDHNYVETLGLKILEGRNFSKNISTDIDNAFIVNEEAAKIIGSPVINKEITIEGDFIGGSSRVIGVVKNFHHSSFHERILPMILDINSDWISTVNISIKPNNMTSTLQFLEDQWKSRIKDRPFEYTFFDEEIGNFYKKENQMAKLLGAFSSLAIIIACLGLFGLVTFISERRTKEIGIRKVLGSTVAGIVFLLVKEIVKWIFISNIIAWPVAYILMNKWLEGFAYKIEIGILIFIISALGALVIALATIGYQAIKAALANPIDALKYE